MGPGLHIWGLGNTPHSPVAAAPPLDAEGLAWVREQGCLCPVLQGVGGSSLGSWGSFLSPIMLCTRLGKGCRGEGISSGCLVVPGGDVPDQGPKVRVGEASLGKVGGAPRPSAVSASGGGARRRGARASRPFLEPWVPAAGGRGRSGPQAGGLHQPGLLLPTHARRAARQAGQGSGPLSQFARNALAAPSYPVPLPASSPGAAGPQAKLGPHLQPGLV